MTRAIVLSGTGADTFAPKMCRLLGFFGLSADVLDTAKCRAQMLSVPENGKSIRLFGSAATVLRLFCDMEGAEERSLLGRQLHSIFVCNDKPVEMASLLKKIAGRKADIEHSKATEFQVMGPKEFCGAMSGVKCSICNASEAIFALKSEATDDIISSENGPVFARLLYNDVPVFFSTAGIIDIDSELGARNFDIRRHFLLAAPVVMYIKSAFAKTCFQPAETNACLVTDDPPLKPRYGYVDFEYLSELTQRYQFSCSLAFIPWNWRRSDSRVVHLFRDNPQRLSLSVHGCDHTRGEFGIQNGQELRWKVLCASQRMKRHNFRTGLRHDPVMVFPQGIFSRTAMRALKGSEFIGVVNSEVYSTERPPGQVRISDFWGVALMNYENFPIFTRRDPWQGVENFAFDILLGKPCIAVVHHNDCHDRCRHVLDFIERLNRLNARLKWRDLGTVVRRSFRERTLAADTVEIEMFGKELLLENPGNEMRHFCIHKRESSPEQLEEIRAGAKTIEWTVEPEGVSFRTSLKPGERQVVRIVFQEFSGDDSENAFAGRDVVYWMKTTCRRYLCEIRDNYVMGKTFSRSHI